MLTEITLKNFRGFEKHTIPFRPLTIIVGKNNAGKSTVVEALRLVSMVTNRYQSLGYRQAPEWAERPRRDRCVKPSTEGLEASPVGIFHRYGDPPANILAKFDTGEEVEVFVGPRLEVVGIIRDGKGEVIRGKGQARQLQLPQVNILPQIGPLPRDEMLLQPDYVRQSISTSRSSLHFRNQIHYAQHFFRDFKSLAERTWHGLEIRRIDADEQDIGRRKLTLIVRDGDFAAEVGWMGHGLQMWLQTMWFLTWSASAKCVILDEPDVYMHADLQRRLIRLMRAREHQTIIATHSVEIMSEVEPDEVLVIDRRRSRSVFTTSHPEVQGLLDALGSMHNIQLARLGVLGRFVLVEGEDMAFLKRFQNALFPDSPTPIDTLPHKSLGGWNGWEKAKGIAMVLKDAGHGGIKTYCILDRDYHTEASVKKRLKSAKAEGIQLHMWKRKEIENYLLVPVAIRRVIDRGAKRGARIPTEAEIEVRLDAIAEELKPAVLQGMVQETWDEDRSLGAGGAAGRANTELDTNWKTRQGKLTVIPGKDAVHRLAEWSSKEFGVPLNPVKLANAITKVELADEVRSVLMAIEGSEDF